MLNKILILFGIASLLQGCATPFSDFYFDKTGGVDITTDPKFIISNENPKIFRGNDEKKDSLAMAENGYVLVG
jgi:hypothetical protein